jgi:hypothetical protein
VYCAFLAKGSHDRIEPFPWKKKFHDVSGFSTKKNKNDFDDTMMTRYTIVWRLG